MASTNNYLDFYFFSFENETHKLKITFALNYFLIRKPKTKSNLDNTTKISRNLF